MKQMEEIQIQATCSAELNDQIEFMHNITEE